MIALADRREGTSPAESAFIEQMKVRRSILGLSQGDVAERVAALGGNMYQQTIAKLESGQRALKLSEADILAKALGTTVHEMIADGYTPHPDLGIKDSMNKDLLEEEIGTVLRLLHEAEAEREHARVAYMHALDDQSRAQHIAMATRAAERAADERSNSLRIKYERLTKQLADWREYEQRTGNPARPRKRGPGFVGLKEEP